MDAPTQDSCRRLLAVVPTSRLEEWGREAGIAMPLPGGAPELVEALIAARKFPFSAKGILERMCPRELELVCRDLGGIGGSLDRARLEERILAILRHEPAAAVPAAPPIPVGAWLEGRRHRAALESERRRRARKVLESTGFRAGSWGALFLFLGWLFVFVHTIDALLLGLGVSAAAFAVYRYELALPVAMGVAVFELSARLLIFGVEGATLFPLVSIIFAEIICTAVMSIDAVSVRTAEISVGFLENLGGGLPRPPPTVGGANAPAEAEPVAADSTPGSAAPR